MIYRVKHITEYRYSVPVSTSHHELHVLMRASTRQRIRAESLTVEPWPSVRRDRFDWFGNRATHWEATRDWVRAAADPEARAAFEWILRSPHVELSAAARDFAEPSFPAGRPLAAAARDLMTRIHEALVYDQTATDVSTSVDEVLRGGRGVCQDFAHVQIACMRALGLPARYVSGYLVTAPEPGKPRLIGADASHAWVSVRSPAFGWLDLDPTNDVVPTDRHVVVAYGRDFDDVTPMRGVLLGGGRHQLHVSVDVEPVDSIS